MEEKKESKNSEHHEHSEAHESHSPKRKNDWKMLSLIFGIVIVILLVIIIYGQFSNSNISGDNAGKKIVEFLNEKTGGGVEFVSAEDKGSIYEVSVSYNNQVIPVYVTKDGSYFVQSIIPITEDNSTQSTDSPSTTTTEVKKSDKPVAQAFIFSYCPYGTQFEKALIPVYDLLKNKVNISIVAIGAMHGEFEHVESLRQICIEKNYGKDKLFSYLKSFDENSAVGSCNGDATCLEPIHTKIYTTLGIDKTKIETCMSKDAEAIYTAQGELSQSLGISGSPTFVINGAQVQVSRTPEAIKQAICSAFTSAPSECSKNLSTSASSAGFGSSAGTSSGASC